MRIFLLREATAAVVIGCVLVTCTASAEQRHDWPLALSPEGWSFTGDVYTGGTQFTFEHLLPIYGSSNDLNTKLIALTSYPYGNFHASLDLRILALRLGVDLGLLIEWPVFSFDPWRIMAKGPKGLAYVGGQYCPTVADPLSPLGWRPTGLPCSATRAARRAMASQDVTDGLKPTPWIEARAQLLVPLNEYVLFRTDVGLQYQDRPPNTFDQVYSMRHDPGLLLRWDSVLFVKQRDWGGFGLYSRLVNVPRDSGRHSEWVYGFLTFRRLGLLRRNDAIALWALFEPTSDEYGIEQYRVPVWAVIVYRVRLRL